MSTVDFPNVDHEDGAFYSVDRDVVLPRPPLALRYEQEQPWEDDLTPDADGDVHFSLPVFARVEVFPDDNSTECFMVATWNKRAFGRGGDGLTAYGCTNRTDFTFRTNVFESFPEVIRHNRVKLRPGEWNEMVLALSEREATYWINRVPVATCILREGDLPSSELYLGLTRYQGRAYSFRRFDVSRDPAVLSVFRDHVVTVHCSAEEDGVSLRCLRMSGEEAAVLKVAGATQLLPGTEVRATRDLVVHPCAEKASGMTIYEGSRRLRLKRGQAARVRRHFDDDGTVSLEPCVGAGTQYLFVPAQEADGLQVQGEERLGEFRARAAAAMGVLLHRMRLVRPDGRLLAESEDSQPLQCVLPLPAAPATSAAAAAQPASQPAAFSLAGLRCGRRARTSAS